MNRQSHAIVLHDLDRWRKKLVSMIECELYSRMFRKQVDLFHSTHTNVQQLLLVIVVQEFTKCDALRFVHSWY